MHKPFPYLIHTFDIGGFTERENEFSKFVYGERRKNVGNVRSNRGGWQSKLLPPTGELEPLAFEISEFCKSIKGFKFTDLTVTKFWANINYENDINWPHKHQGDLSGVFYLQATENSGDLILENPNYDMNNKISSHLHNKFTIAIRPIKNKLILFDANCLHLVTKNNCKQPRISISFNIVIND